MISTQKAIFASDGYEHMAGADFDAFYAGGRAYHIATIPKPNLSWGFLDEPSSSLSELLFAFNENFAEFVLLPMQVMIFTKPHPSNSELLFESIKQVNTSTKAIKDMLKSGNDKAISALGGVGIKSGNMIDDRGLQDFAAEMVGDSFLEDSLEAIGSMYAGAFGAALAGMLHDLAVGEVAGAGNIAEALYNSVSSTFASVAVEAGVTAVGASISPLGIMGLAFGIKEAINEAFEVATGLDRNFGFGGELVGISSIDGVKTAVYDGEVGFMDGLLGGKRANNVVDYAGKVVGFRVGRQYATISKTGELVHAKTGSVYTGTSVMQNKFSEFVKSGYDPDTLDRVKNIASAESMLESALSHSLELSGVKVGSDFISTVTNNVATSLPSLELSAPELSLVHDKTQSGSSFGSGVGASYDPVSGKWSGTDLSKGIKNGKIMGISDYEFSIPGGMRGIDAMKASAKASYERYKAEKQAKENAKNSSSQAGGKNASRGGDSSGSSIGSASKARNKGGATGGNYGGSGGYKGGGGR